MKVLCVVHAFVGGGIEQYLLNVLDYMDRRDVQMEILGTADESVYTHIGELVKREVPFHYLHSKKLSARLREWAKLLRTNKYDIVHIHGMPNTGVIWLTSGKWVSPGTKFIVHAHMGVRTDMGKGVLRRVAYQCCYCLTNWLYQVLADVRAGCSEEAMRLHFGSGIKTDGLLLKNGIDMERFCSSRTPRVTSRRMIAVARIDYLKNPLFLVELVAELVKRHAGWHLTWIGEGSMEKVVKERICELGVEHHITMPGFRKDIPEHLSRNELFLLPSLKEAFSIAAVEAQAAGCVCVASTSVPEAANCGAMVRLPLEKGVTGWADFIEALYETSTEFPVDKAKMRSFDVRVTTEELKGLYRSLLKR